jgi:hypothetical protein
VILVGVDHAERPGHDPEAHREPRERDPDDRALRERRGDVRRCSRAGASTT